MKPSKAITRDQVTEGTEAETREKAPSSREISPADRPDVRPPSFRLSSCRSCSSCRNRFVASRERQDRQESQEKANGRDSP